MNESRGLQTDTLWDRHVLRYNYLPTVKRTQFSPDATSSILFPTGTRPCRQKVRPEDDEKKNWSTKRACAVATTAMNNGQPGRFVRDVVPAEFVEEDRPLHASTANRRCTGAI